MKENEENLEKLNNIYGENTFGAQFLIYLRSKTGLNNDVDLSNLNIENLNNEFTLKCLFIQRVTITKHSMTGFTMEQAAIIINKPESSSFNRSISGELFDGFMHFIVANDPRPAALKSLMDTWIAQGRTLTEKLVVGGDGFTPLNYAMVKNNIAAVRALIEHGVDITELNYNGFSELHILINNIEDGISPVSLLKNWVDAGLPINMQARNPDPKYFGKTALQLALDKGLVEAVELLGGDIEAIRLLEAAPSVVGPADAILEELSTTQQENEVQGSTVFNEANFAQIRQQHLTTSIDTLKANIDEIFEKMKLDVLEDYEKEVAKLANNRNMDYELLFLHILKKFNEIPIEVIIKIVLDENIALYTELIDKNGVSALQHLVAMGVNPQYDMDKANEFAVILAARGAGTIRLDHGSTLLSHAAKYNNEALIKLIFASNIKATVNSVKIIEIEELKVVDSPLTYALLGGRENIAEVLVAHGYDKCKFIIDGKGDLEFGLIKSIRTLCGIHASAILKSVGRFIDMKSEEVTQELLNAIIKDEHEFIKAVLDNGGDINFNDGEMLKLFIDNDMVLAINRAIFYGATVTEEIKNLIIQKGLLESIPLLHTATLIDELDSKLKALPTSEIVQEVRKDEAYEMKSKPLSKSEKMKHFLQMVIDGAGDQEVNSWILNNILGNEIVKYSALFAKSKNNKVAFESFCKLHKVSNVKSEIPIIKPIENVISIHVADDLAPDSNDVPKILGNIEDNDDMALLAKIF